MAWILPRLKYRVQIGTPVQTPNDDGGLDFSFDDVATIWMGFKTISERAGGKYVGGKQVTETATHEFICRALAASSALGADLMPLKSNYFLFLQKGSIRKGRLFRIHEIMNVLEQDEYFSIIAEEIEERGTGYPE